MTMKLHLAALTLALAAAAGGCVKKGSGKGSRDKRPNFRDSGTLGDNGPEQPKPPGNTPDNDETDPKLDAEAAAILAACFKIDVKDVAYVPGWDDAQTARDAATALCAKLDKVGYKDGVSPTAEQVAVD